MATKNTYEIRCSGGAMGNGLYLDGNKRRAMCRGRVYAGEGLLGQGMAQVYEIRMGQDGRRIEERLGGFRLGFDGKVSALS